jgi:hypothetical protein
MADGDLKKKVLQYVKARDKKQIGSGECFDLADEALRNSGAKTAADFGRVTKDADYIWGTEIKNLTRVQPGDVLQFRDHKATVTTSRSVKLAFPDGSWLEYETFNTRTFKRGHHTAVAASSARDGKITVFEQHVMRGKKIVDKRAGLGIVYMSSKDHEPKESTERIKIDQAWAKELGSIYRKAQDRKRVDQIAKKYNGKSLQATVVTKTSTTVSGTLRAFQPQSR